MRVDELRRLKRDELIARAESVGVARPGVLTQAELIDEIVKRAAPAGRSASVRGWLGRARDLVAQVVSKGLHLPEAALLFAGPPPASLPKPPPPLPTVTLAEIYAAQGHLGKAIAVLDEVVEREPDHALAAELRTRLASQHAPRADTTEVAGAARGDRRAASEQVLAGDDMDGERPADTDRTGARHDAPDAGAAGDVASISLHGLTTPEEEARGAWRDDVVALATDAHTAYVYWELRPVRFARARHDAPGGALVLRVVTSRGRGAEVETVTHDVVVDGLAGDTFVRGLLPDSEVRLCLGWRAGAELIALGVAAPLQMPRDYGPTDGSDAASATRDARAPRDEGRASGATHDRLHGLLTAAANGLPVPLADLHGERRPRWTALDLGPGRATSAMHRHPGGAR